MPTILEFHIQPVASDNFNVTVCERGSSQPLASSQFSFPLSDWMTKHDIAKLEFNPRDPHGRLEELRKFGGKLYQLLFSPEIQQLWQQTRDRAEFLTLCLRMDDAAKGLEALPWEALHDGTEFIAAGAKTTVTRLPLGIVPPRDLPAIPSPLRMLALVSSPPDLPDQMRLNVEAEQEIILEAINAPAGQGKLSVDFEDEAKLAILESSLEAGYHILHFTGHGVAPDNGGGLLLEDPDGKAQVYGAAEILRTLEKGFDTLRLAVISGCNTAQTKTQNADSFRDLARTLAAKKVPAVLAMQFKLSDTGGLKLAEVLYPKLVAGQTLEVAVNAARRALLLSDDPVLQGDALALVLIVADGNCLQTKAADAPTLKHEVTIDTKFQLGVLPQLGFGFYGRRKDYRQLRDALLVNNHRAAVIHGIGGIGKTSLSAHAADRLYKRRQLFNGVYAFDCSGGTLAPERIILELRDYFKEQGIDDLNKLANLPIKEPEEVASKVALLLMQWPLLLIFDNFETQLVRTDEGFRIADESLRHFLAALVKATAANTKFVFTSRFLFDLDARLGHAASLPLGDLSRPEAINLMMMLPNLAEKNYFDKAKAYECFGGHPLAITQLDKYCEDRSLYEALQDAKTVHAKLREHLALGLNYGRLSEQARELLNRLAAFRVAVPMEAAEWVIGKTVVPPLESLQPIIVTIRQDENAPAELKDADDATLLQILSAALPVKREPPSNLPQLVSELIDWGLLTPVYEGDKLYRLDIHNLVRDFCREKQAGIWRNSLREAASFYTNLTERTPKEQRTSTMIWNEMEAFELLVEADDIHNAGKLLSNAHELLDRWGFGRYIERQYERLLDRLEYQDDAVLLNNLGTLQRQHGNYDEAMKYLHRSLKIAEDTNDIAGAAISLHHIGWVLQDQGKYDEAIDYYQRSIKLSEEINDLAGLAYSLHQLGWVQQDRGNYNEALNYYHRSLKILEEINDVARIAITLHQIGVVQQACGNYDEALRYFQRSLKIKEEINDLAGVAYSLGQLGNVQNERGNYDEALDYYQRSLNIAKEIGNVAGVALAQEKIGQLLMEAERYDEAFRLLLSTIGIFAQMHSPNAEIIVGSLKTLRSRWDGFDAAWQEVGGGDIPKSLE